jgi:uncharacterized RDD family membrane protein YckC
MASLQPALTPDSRQYAGLGPRLGAYLVDLLIAFSLLIVVAMLLRVFRAFGIWEPGAGTQLQVGSAGMTPEEIWRSLGAGAKLAVIIAFVLSQGAIYRVLFEASAWQATVGKRLFNVYVTDERGARISLARSFGRWLSRYFLDFFFGSPISAITIAATSDRKALHDWMAKTAVLRGRPELSGPIEMWRIAAAFLIPFAWMLGTFLRRSEFPGASPSHSLKILPSFARLDRSETSPHMGRFGGSYNTDGSWIALELRIRAGG